MDIQHYMQTLGRQARAASRVLAAASTAAKNAARSAPAAPNCSPPMPKTSTRRVPPAWSRR